MDITKYQILEQLAKMYGSDKALPNPETNPSGHGYMEFYADHLPDKCMSLLEIGCYKGASLKMWDDYYGAKCDIWCLDLFKNPELMSVRECRDAGFIPVEGDQSDIRLLESINKQFEVIIDDGSHRADHQLISFKQLFRSNLVSGGLYVIEDLHCNKDPYYWMNDVVNFYDTPLRMLQLFQETGKIANWIFEPHEAEQVESMIESVHIFNEEIAFIKRK